MAKLKLSDLPQTPAPPSRDPRQLLLERAAKRLVQLLRESDDRESEMREIVRRLDAQDLLGWSPTMDKGPYQFAMEVVEENLLLR